MYSSRCAREQVAQREKAFERWLLRALERGRQQLSPLAAGAAQPLGAPDRPLGPQLDGDVLGE